MVAEVWVLGSRDGNRVFFFGKGEKGGVSAVRSDGIYGFFFVFVFLFNNYRYKQNNTNQ